MEKILHLLWGSNLGGVEKLCLLLGEHDKENNLFCIVNEKGSFYRQMEQGGLQIYFLGLGLGDTVKIYRKIRQMYREKIFTVLFVHHSSTPLWMAAMLLKQSCPKCRVYLYAHCDYADIINGKKTRKYVFAAATKRADGVIAISNYVKSSVVKGTGVVPEKIHVVYNGVDIEKFAAVQRTAFDGTMRLVYVGRLSQAKGVHVLLDALRMLKGEVPFQCTIVGYGDCAEALREQAEKSGIAQEVIFTGLQKEVRPYLAGADLFVHPAVWEEGFGLTLVEAMAGGLPCAAFKKGGIPEIIADGEEGFLVEPVSAEALAEKLREIYALLGTEKYTRICANAQEKAKRFTKENYFAGLQRVADGKE